MTSTTDIKIQSLGIEKLKDNERNTRVHSDEQIEQIVASINEFGFTNPILIDEKNVLLAGHGRLLAARKIGLKKVPIIRLENLTEKQKRAYVIADNKLALNSEWNDSLLQMEMQELHNMDFDLTKLGWSDTEISSFVGWNMDEFNIEKDFEGAREIGLDDLGTMSNKCPRCGFEYD